MQTPLYIRQFTWSQRKWKLIYIVEAQRPYGQCAQLWLSRPGSSPGRGHCVLFLGKTLYFHSASLHPGVQTGTGEFSAGSNPSMDWHPIRGRVEIYLVASCHGNWLKLKPDRPLGLYEDFTFHHFASIYNDTDTS